MTMLEATFSKLNAALPPECKRDLRTIALIMQSEAQQKFGECPFCEVPIGSMYHYTEWCPFTLTTLMDNLLGGDH